MENNVLNQCHTTKFCVCVTQPGKLVKWFKMNKKWVSASFFTLIYNV